MYSEKVISTVNKVYTLVMLFVIGSTNDVTSQIHGLNKSCAMTNLC